MVLNFFCILIVKKNTVLFKFLIVSTKTLTNSGDFIGSRIRISNSGGTSKRVGNLNSALKKQTASHPPVILKNYPLLIFLNFSQSSPAYGTIYRITGGFLNATTSILKRISVRIFTTRKCFHKRKQKIEFLFRPDTAPTIFLNHQPIDIKN
jgi:hypothetical protein